MGADDFYDALRAYVRKHGLCSNCSKQVFRAFDLLMGYVDCKKEPGYAPGVYFGLTPSHDTDSFIVSPDPDVLSNLMGEWTRPFARTVRGNGVPFVFISNGLPVSAYDCERPRGAGLYRRASHYMHARGTRRGGDVSWQHVVAAAPVHLAANAHGGAKPTPVDVLELLGLSAKF